MMVLNTENHNHVVGLLTSRDLLRIIASGVKDSENSDAILNRSVGEYMTPISQVIYARPDETVGMVRSSACSTNLRADRLLLTLIVVCLPYCQQNQPTIICLNNVVPNDYGETWH